MTLEATAATTTTLDRVANTFRLRIEGMTCASCVTRVERALSRVPSVRSAVVNLATESAHVVSGAGAVDQQSLLEAVRKAGYQATVSDATSAGRSSNHSGRSALIASVLAFPLFSPMIGLLWGEHWMLPAWLQFTLATPVQFVLGARFYRAAWHAVRAGTGNMDLLVALGTSASWALSTWSWLNASGNDMPELWFEASAMVIALVLVGKWLDSRAKAHAVDAISALSALRPTRARVRRGDIEVELPIESLVVGDLMVVLPGERISADGVIEAGAGHVDESMVTGESIPIARTAGDRVIGGTVNGDGRLAVRVDAVGAASMLDRVRAMVETAQGAKPAIQHLVDRVSAVFVPTVLAIALATAIAWGLATDDWRSAVLHAVAVLVIACPCALGLATPAALIVGIGAAARRGILIRDPDALQTARSIRVVAFDKTGTLTEGRPRLVSVITADPTASRETAIGNAANLAIGSEHPLAKAVVAANQAHTAGGLSEIEAVPGSGIRGRGQDGSWWHFGSLRYMQALGVDTTSLAAAADMQAAAARSVSWLAHGDTSQGSSHAVAVFAFEDAIRPEARAAIDRLESIGIAVALVTGDNESTASRVARDVGIRSIRAQALPEDKIRAIEALRADHGAVAMVGDGVNDAPALATADLGIAMGTGTDVAMHTAGITLMRPDPRLVADAIDLSRRTYRKIRQNLFWAFIYNVIGIPLAAFGLLTPVFASAAMAASSVSVIGNALMLRRQDRSGS